MSESKHTPGRLVVGPLPGQIMSEDGRLVANCSIFPGTFNEDRANAEHIVRTWNAHDELLEACKAALAYDKAIRGKAAAGDFSELNPRGALAEGVDLDALYESWISLSMMAVAKAEGRS